MSVTRSGKQIPFGHSRSHVSGKNARRFAARIKDNLDKQCKRLERELCGNKNGPEATPPTDE